MDGRLHVALSNLSKACVSLYRGAEIPEDCDLNRMFRLFRDPAELAKATPTFNNIPVLTRHVPVSAADHQPNLVVGATGSNAKFVAPYLQNSMVIWTAAAIADIESGKRQELSAAYRYTVDWTSGEFEGARYDGRMVGIVANHVALVPEGRVGPDCVVGDARPSRNIDTFNSRYPMAARIGIA